MLCDRILYNISAFNQQSFTSVPLFHVPAVDRRGSGFWTMMAERAMAGKNLETQGQAILIAGSASYFTGLPKSC